MEVLDDINPIGKNPNTLQVAAVISTALNKGNVVIVSSQIEVDIIRDFFRPESQDDFVTKKQEGIFSLCRTNKWLVMHRARLSQKFSP